ncbi:DJ-1/PfpI family protein [Candidatus Marsarchaeota archaeon]|jgi:putative intracellular protease/amidase|nr:DJ-1/PfpI family protein [Candidatus Marsarchaeota archaeon]MCL5100021.1 DJ-1/PfpI family protein [Candidatus Marsarchaeota archaeon]
MTFLVFLPPKDFRDETLNMVKLFFDRWRVPYKITSYSKGTCIGRHGETVKPDINTGMVSAQDYDGIVLVDGAGIDSYKLYEFRPLLDLMMQFDAAKKYIAAIDNSVKIVARANIIKGKGISTPSDEETKRLVVLFHGVPTENEVEFASNIITIRNGSGVERGMDEMLSRIGVK